MNPNYSLKPGTGHGKFTSYNIVNKIMYVLACDYFNSCNVWALHPID